MLLVSTRLLDIQRFIKAASSRCTHQSLAALYDDELLLRGGPGKHNLCVIPQDVVHLFLGEIFQVRAVDHAGLGIPEHGR